MEVRGSMLGGTLFYGSTGVKGATRVVVGLLSIALLVVACGPADEVQETAAQRQEGSAETPVPEGESGSGAQPEGDATAVPEGDETGDSAPGRMPQTQSEEDVEPTPTPQPLPLEAELAHDCVQSGGTQTLTVRTEPWTGVAFEATYSDGKSGAEPPYGEGYGGNDGDIARNDGRAEFTWQISTDAPTGEVEVLVKGVKNGYSPGEQVVTFMLQSSTDPCL